MISGVRRSSFRQVIFAASLVAISCGTDSSDISARVSALGEEGIPAGVTCLQIRIVRDGEESPPQNFTEANLMDRDGNGRRESLISSSVLPDFGTPFEIRVSAFQTGSNLCVPTTLGAPDFVGSTGSIVLSAGERRVLDIALYAVNEPAPLERGIPLPPRWLHTSTLLNDGRILIAGGFDSLTQITCPEPTLIADACYRATASSDAYILDVPTGQFFPIEGGMRAARGGHTATVLSDGRVLIAGGATEAILVINGVDSDSGLPLNIRVIPLQADRAVAHANFELFDRTSPDLSADPTRTGFRSRGVFTGPSSAPDGVGTMNQERFMHAAATVDRNRVLLGGGLGGDRARETYEVFDALKAGGEGVYQDSRELQAPRESPSAFVVDGSIWLWGGGDADEPSDVAEIWDGGSEVGSTMSASLPQEDDNAEFDLIRPNIIVNESQNGAIITGWYGPRCPFDDLNTPAFGIRGRMRCREPLGAPFRSLLLSPMASNPIDAFAPPNAIFQAFAASDLRAENDTAIVSGGIDVSDGIGGAMFETENAIIIYGFEGARIVVDDGMIHARAFHRSTLAPGGLLVTTGGLYIRDTSAELVSLSSEVFMFTPIASP